ncbi:flagellar filament capping protein FliD [Kamptonema cortianum]|nr:flagellar filament capping protein FliD [Geitlerinema splendidum]MDK3158845.1 flagellar filament capping protein FliD [Kamptonema cortianum]
MSVNGPLSGIRFSGLGSGIDVDSIVSQLINLERAPITRLRSQQAKLFSRQTIYSQYRGKLLSLNSAASALSFSSAYSAVTASSNKTDIATATASEGAAAGTYSVTVSQLAKAHKVTSTAQASTTNELGLTGVFMINGKAITVEATDNLTAIATKINSDASGLTATVINGGTGQAFLSLTASNSGIESKIQLSNVSGSALSSLGLLTGAATVRESVNANTIRSYGQTSSTRALQVLTGATMSGSFDLGGTNIAVNFASDSLQAIADKINLAAGGDTASVVSVTENGVTKQKLEISGTNIPGGITDSDGILEALGVLQKGFGQQITAAQNATGFVDGVPINSATNTVAGVVSGLTLTLASEGAATITVNRDSSKIKDSVKALMTAYNDAVDFVRQNSKFDSETFQSGPLFGDQTVSIVENSMSQLLFSNVGSGSLANLTSIGFTFDDQGKLQLNESQLDTAIATKLDDLRKLMMATGSSTNSNIKFVTSGTKTLSSNPSGYGIDITQAATKSNLIAQTQQTSPNAGGEQLTFSGTLFGASDVVLSVSAGSTLADLVAQINADSRLKDLVIASIDGGALKIESKRFGAPGGFSVVSNLAAAADNSGLGTTLAGYTAGLDVAGTINGEAATGSGQFLTGDTGNSNTAGLQIQYTGLTTGFVGSMIFNRGVASLMTHRLDSYTDSVDGLITSIDKTLTLQSEDIDERIASIELAIQLKEQSLRRRFAAMEAAISQLNSQGSQLGAVLNRR